MPVVSMKRAPLRSMISHSMKMIYSYDGSLFFIWFVLDLLQLKSSSGYHAYCG
jgi:hypothetical protein